jgi:hypothetical protein
MIDFNSNTAAIMLHINGLSTSYVIKIWLDWIKKNAALCYYKRHLKQSYRKFAKKMYSINTNEKKLI